MTDPGPLTPAIIQDVATRQVLMLGWMSAEALELTEKTGLVHFWSRSRGELWQKGATSGNRLAVAEILRDCDGDTLLVTATPVGPTCHTGSDTCWGQDNRPGFTQLDRLWETIQERARHLPPDSYTTSLLRGGPDGAGRKITEEAVEVLLAARDHLSGAADDLRLAEEVADLIYHTLVLCVERGLDPSQVMDVLESRQR